MEKMLGQHLANITKQATERLNTEPPAQEPTVEKEKYQVRTLRNEQDAPYKDPSRYLVTSQRFTGTAELLYIDAELQEVKMMGTNMRSQQRHSFKALCPVWEGQLPEFCRHTGVYITRTVYEVSFDQFWNDYHKTLEIVKEHKDRTIPLWSKLELGERVKAWLYIKEYHAFLQLPRNKGRGIKNADTYLKAKMWGG